MSKKIETFGGAISEFVDWVTGKDSNTNTNVTNNLPVSGGSIRALLQDRLKTPFYMYEDTENNLYRMFSSEKAKDLWLSDKETYAKLELFNFARPSDYSINDSISSDPRYVISGDSTQSAATLTYTWEVKNSTSVNNNESLSATYTITDADGNQTTFSQLYASTNRSISINLYDYLKSGQNTVSVALKGVSTGAVSIKTFIITVLTLELSSTFVFNEKHIQGEKLNIPYILNRNITTLPMSVLFYIDGTLANQVDITANSASTSVSNTLSITNTYGEGAHNLQIYTEVQYNTSTFRSNILYYTFENATSSSTALNYFINVKNSFKSNTVGTLPIQSFYLTGTQFQPVTLEWGYYTDNLQQDTEITVEWKLLQNSVYTDLATITADYKQQASNLSFIPTIYTTNDNPASLVAFYGTKQLISIPITIIQSSLALYETSNYTLKLSAYGKTNSSSDKANWKDNDHNISASFTGDITWDNTLGWYKNSLRLSGVGNYATINYAPMSVNPSNGKTIEFEFESEKVNTNSDVIIQIGNTSGGHINVTPNTATLYDASGNEVIHTNYKANERVKLAFIFNEQNTTTDSNLVYIVNNGILERATGIAGYVFTNTSGKITIGNSNSGIRFYSIRVYDRAISYTDAYNNFVYDNDDKLSIVANNNIVTNSTLDYDLCVNKIDTILISGDLSKILNASYDKDQSLSDATIERYCPSDTTKNFKIVDGQIRKHGQSTLNYPVTSMKFWSNKSTTGTTPVFTCAGQSSLLLNKSRYKMKDTSIPANKWVLQANYADSSGVHNGGFERLIQDTWFNAKFSDGEYKLRTAPQLFTTNTSLAHNNKNLNETGIWNNYDNTISKDGYNIDGKQWSDYFTTDFPYTIRTAPDSFPCAVFYKDTSGSNKKTFLGQYVFMEDKGSDFCYGERSIYKASAKDPFCLTTTHKSDDTDENCIWNNKDVLRIEVLNVNSKFSSYLSSDNFTDVVYDDTTGQPSSYKWEADFEMIYPDPDDLTGNSAKGTDKFGANSKFVKTATPFIEWFKWLVSTKNNPTKFQAEAAQHIDLYKMAAYYIYMLRGALVDSGERNVQIKTYDGVHFHYEPWDMDIAMGNKNTGGIAFDPPVDRNTTLPGDSSTYAISGRNGLKGSSNYTSNWLWDALEGWDYWINTVVPETAQALYTAGLSYDNMIAMFDGNYADKWCEIMYNESGHFKYVDSRKGSNSWLNWLQGARTTHRHWWLNKSMDYYDAKWNCGDFKNHVVYFGVNHAAKNNDNTDIITVSPSNSTFFNITLNDTVLSTQYATKDSPAKFDISKVSISTKTPLYLYGATQIEELDLSCLSSGIDSANLGGSYSSVTGASLKTLNIGCPIVKGSDDYTYTGTVNGLTSINIGTTDADGNDALESIQNINIRGQKPFTSWSEFYEKDRAEVQNVYAMGSGLTNFFSSKSGNKFKTLELPEINVLRLYNSTWNTMTFYKTTLNGTSGTFTKCNINSDYSLNIPSSLTSVYMLGTTGANKNSKDFVLNWIKCIQANNQSIGDMTLLMDGINWSKETCGESNLLTYDELALLAQFNKGLNKASDALGADGGAALKGYIMLSVDTPLTAQQLTQIKAWFGDTVFNKNSAGLVIDQAYDYIQISVGGSDITIIDNEIYLKEGKRASLNANKFALSEDNSSYDWFLKDPNSTNTSNPYKMTSITKGDDGIYYLTPAESSLGNYDVVVLCSGGTLTAQITIHIVSVTYPSKFVFNTSNSAVRAFNNSFAFPDANVSSELYLTASEEYNATLTGVTFTIKNEYGTKLLDNISYQSFTGGTATPIQVSALDDCLYYLTNAVQKYSIPLYSMTAKNEASYYTLIANTTFKSGKVMTTTVNIIVMLDQTVILANDGSTVYTVINSAYNALYGSVPLKYYRSHLMAITGTVDFSSNTSWAETTSLKTANNRSILRYLTNVTSLILDGGTVLTSTNTDITDTDQSQLVFSEMTKLTSLSLKNCKALTSNINLENNTSLVNLDMTGDTINVTLPVSSNIQSLKLGTPTSVSINSPVSLTPTGLSMDSSDNIDSLDLTQVNSSENNTYKTFAKIYNV